MTDQELIDWARNLVDSQEGGDAVVLVQRQKFNRMIGRLAALTAPVTVTDANVKRASWEFLLDRGMQPWHVTRRGAELWEDYAPAMRAALEAALALSLQGEGNDICMGECATEGCDNCGHHYFESGDVGSYYCFDCLQIIKGQQPKPTEQGPAASELLVVAWLWAVVATTDSGVANAWEKAGYHVCPLTSHTEATRIIADLKVQRDDYITAMNNWHNRCRKQNERAEKAEALIAELVEGLEIAREQVLAVCEHNERVNNGARSEMDRNDLERIDVLIAKARAS